MRILHVAHAIPPDGNTGVENYTAALAHAQAQAGYMVAVWARGGEGAAGTETRTEHDGVLTVRVALGKNHQFGHKRVRWEEENRFQSFVQEWKPDVVHFQHLLFQSLGFPRIARQNGAATLLTLHDFWWTCPVVQRVDFRQNLCRVPPGRVCLACVWNGRRAKTIPAETVRRVSETPFLRRVLDLVPTSDDLTDWAENSQTALNDVQTVLAPSQFVADNLREFGVSHPDVVLSPYGVAHPNGLPSTEEDTPPAEQSGPFRFGMIGTHPKKGVAVAVEAFRLLPPDVPARLLIYGGELINAANLPPKVEAQGKFSAAEIERVYASFDVLIVPSLWWENAPFVIREAFARKKVVLASDLGGMAESVRNGVDGLLFPAGDAPALAALVQGLCAEPQWLIDLQSGITPPVWMDEHMADLNTRYANALAGLQSAGSTKAVVAS